MARYIRIVLFILIVPISSSAKKFDDIFNKFKLYTLENSGLNISQDSLQSSIRFYGDILIQKYNEELNPDELKYVLFKTAYAYLYKDDKVDIKSYYYLNQVYKLEMINRNEFPTSNEFNYNKDQIPGYLMHCIAYTAKGVGKFKEAEYWFKKAEKEFNKLDSEASKKYNKDRLKLYTNWIQNSFYEERVDVDSLEQMKKRIENLLNSSSNNDVNDESIAGISLYSHLFKIKYFLLKYKNDKVSLYDSVNYYSRKLDLLIQKFDSTYNENNKSTEFKNIQSVLSLYLGEYYHELDSIELSISHLSKYKDSAFTDRYIKIKMLEELVSIHNDEGLKKWELVGEYQKDAIAHYSKIISVQDTLIISVIKNLDDIYIRLNSESYERKREKESKAKAINALIVSIVLTIIAVVLSISLKIQTKKLRIKEKLEKEYSIIKTLFITIIAHDTKGRINALVGYLEHYFKDQLDEESPKNILILIRAVRQTLENLLLWAKPQLQDNYNIELSVKKIYFSKFLMKFQTLFLPKEKGGVQLIFNIPDGLFVYADPDLLSIIIQNLLDNAIKFTEKGKIIITAIDRKKDVEIRISDSGKGMNQAELKNLFKIDQKQQDNSFSGFGLIITQKLLEKHNSKLKIESQPNEGSHFSFVLPKSQASLS